MTSLLTRVAAVSRLKLILRKLISNPKIKFENSASYWEDRYSSSGNSGDGSYGRLADFKAQVINDFVRENKINTVIEWGCGDGNQLSLASYPNYVGLDVSETAIDLCKARFEKDPQKHFHTLDEAVKRTAHLALSLDVIYHLVEDDIYEKYMDDLFESASEFVCIYSSNFDQESGTNANHVKHRCFTNWVNQRRSDFALCLSVPNPYPKTADRKIDTSYADFYFYKRTTNTN